MREPVGRVVLLLTTAFSLLFGSWAYASEGIANAYELKIQADRLLREGRIVQAIPLYERVLHHNKRFANAYYNLATAYYLQKELGRAAENLAVFLKLRPEDGEAYYNLACLKLRLGVLSEAVQCLRKAGRCVCSPRLSQKIKEALCFTKDLRSQNPEIQNLTLYLAQTSV